MIPQVIPFKSPLTKGDGGGCFPLDYFTTTLLRIRTPRFILLISPSLAQSIITETNSWVEVANLNPQGLIYLLMGALTLHPSYIANL